MSKSYAEDVYKTVQEGTYNMLYTQMGAQEPPFNPVSNTQFTGINSVVLQCKCKDDMHQEFSDPRWVTYKQANQQGWSIKKGEKATTVSYMKTHEKNEQGQNVKLDKPQISYSNVFNASQINGIPPYNENQIKQEQHNIRDAQGIADAVESGSKALSIDNKMVQYFAQKEIALRCGVKDLGFNEKQANEINSFFGKEKPDKEKGIELMKVSSEAHKLTKFCLGNEKYQAKVLESQAQKVEQAMQRKEARQLQGVER